MADQFERRQGMRCRDGWHWTNWQPCDEATALRVSGLKSWQVRHVSVCAACGGTGRGTVSAPIPSNSEPANESGMDASELLCDLLDAHTEMARNDGVDLPGEVKP